MRIAASIYLNSAPLVYSFSRGALKNQYAFIGDAAPWRCARMLASGECEIALIPVIEYQRISNLLIIPDVAVASKNRVRSVLVASRCPLEEVRTLALDTSSRTAQALVKILFAQRYGALPEMVERTPNASVDGDNRGENMLEETDAALLIGDPAMRLAACAERLGLRIYDLAEEWRGLTGLPVVFAVWAIRSGAFQAVPVIVRDLVAAKREGLAQLRQIALQYAGKLGLPTEDLLSYLLDNVNFDLDEENIAGMRQYFRLAHQCGLISEVRDLRFAPREALAGARIGTD